VKSAAVIAFRSSYRDRSFSPGSYERETFALTSLETVTEALLEIMEVCVSKPNYSAAYSTTSSVASGASNEMLRITSDN